MKTSRRMIPLLIAAFGLALAASGTSFAQLGPKGGRMDPSAATGRGFSQLLQNLDLSDEQASRVRQIVEAHRAEGREWMVAHPSATMEERRSFMNEHRSVLTSRLSEVLTSDQVAAFEETMDAWRERAVRGMRGRPPRLGGPIGLMSQRMIDRLDLSTEQAERLRLLQRDHRAEMLAWREENPDASAEELRVFRLEQWKEMESDLESVLTEEQRSELKSMREAGRGSVDHWRGRRGGRRGGRQ